MSDDRIGMYPRSLRHLLAAGAVNAIQYQDKMLGRQWQEAGRWLGRILVEEEDQKRAAEQRGAVEGE